VAIFFLGVKMFTKDSRTENFLTQMGVEFSYSNNVSFGELVSDWESTNLARPVPIREEAVLEYSTLMQSGSPAPATILIVTKNGLDVLDGVQRLAAANLASVTSISAYIVTCDSANVIAAIRVLANARLQGRPEPPEWTRKRAVEVLVVQKGLSVAEVARMGGWSQSQVESTARLVSWGGLIESVDGPELPGSMIDLVAKNTTKEEIVACREPISEFLRLVKRAKFSTADAEPFVTEFFSRVVKKSKRHSIYLKRLEDFKADPEVEVRIKGRKGAGISTDILLRRSMKTSITVLDDMLSDSRGIIYVDEFYKLLGEIEDRLRKLPSNLPQPTAVRVPADKWKK